MDEHLFSVKAVKSFRNAHNTFENRTKFKVVKNEDFEPLTTKNAVKFLLEGSLKYRVCRYCLNVTSQLSEPDEIFEVARKGAIFKVTLRDMIACVHPFQAANDPNFPSKICSRCVENAINSYLFSQQCERSERALRNCFEDIHDKFEKLDPLERGKKRGRQKANPNPNVLYTEHNRVVDYAEPIINIINIGSTSTLNEREINELECPKCWQILPDVESLLNHENLHPKSMWYSCRLCGQSFVKQRQYKKHIKDIHFQNNVTRESKSTTFKCNDCGFTSYSLSQHLQHMEKHKFKTTFEHLIDRSMNQLCAVCLDKGSCMIHFNETIEMNGGYPGINNEKTICDIISSTFPERKSYKYQELVIPMKAKLMTIRKRMDYRRKKNLTTIHHQEKIRLNFCDPIILSTQNIEFETLYIFILSQPLLVTELGFSSLVSGDSLSSSSIPIAGTEIDKEKNLVATQFNLIEHDENKIKINLRLEDAIEEENQQPNTSTDISYTYNISGVTQGHLLGNPLESCKTCWIFKKPSCHACLNNIQRVTNDFINIENKEYSPVDNDGEVCRYCWLFTCVGKCNYCKKYIKPTAETTTVDNNMLESNLILNNEIACDITKHETNHSNMEMEKVLLESNVFSMGTRKRKLPTESSTPRKQRWLCYICLTNNDKNRETCFCCEFDRSVLNNKVKYNFGMNKHLYELSTPQCDTAFKISELTNDNKVSSQTKCNEQVVQLPVVNAPYTKTPAQDVIPMDTEITSFYNQSNLADKKLDKPLTDELMDVSYDVFPKLANLQLDYPVPIHTSSSTVSPNMYNVNSTSFTYPNMSLQFTIGSLGSNNVKKTNSRNMRHLRRVANMHK